MNINNNKTGFTLLEIIIVLGIFITITSAVTAFIIIDLKANRFAFEQNEGILYGQKGLKILLQELREAMPGDNGDYPIQQADDFTLTFYGDVDKDEAVEKVRYFLDGTELKRGLIEPSGIPVEYDPLDENISVVSKYVQNGASPIFYYYNGDWPADALNNPLPTPADIDEIKLVKIYLKINFNPDVAPDDFEISSYAQLRNLKDNL